VKKSYVLAWFLSGSMAFAAGNGSQPLPKASYLKKPASENPPTMESYNAPASISVRSSWDLFVTGSFIYWQAREDGLEFGVSTDSLTTGQTIGSLIQMDFPYKPGFKAGLGWHATDDNWDLYAEYTWLYMSHARNATGSETPLFSKWFETNAYFSTMQTFWKCHLDIGDLNLSRSFYVGRCLTVKPFFGPRGVWLRQRYNQHGITIAAPIGPEATMEAKSRSWSVGPRIGFDANWILVPNLRFFGKAAASLLYTRYRVRYDSQSTTTPALVDASTRNQVSSVRPNAEIGGGFAWGGYFSNYTWYMELAASYDFQVFWSQNMMANLASNSQGFNDSNIGNLYYNGLTATLRIDF
jgi:hypothetical protein